MSRMPRPKAINQEMEKAIRSVLGGGGSTLSGKAVSNNAAMRQATVYSCVNVLSRVIGMLPCHTMERVGKIRNVANDFSLYPILHDMPNEWMTAPEFWGMAMNHLSLRGNFYALKVRSLRRDGEIVELIPFAPDIVTEVVQNKDYSLLYKCTYPDGSRIDIPGSEIMHLRGMTMNGYIGMNPIEYIRESIGLGLATEEFGARYFGSGTHPGVVVEHPGKLTEAAHKNLKDSLGDAYSGLGKSHRLMLLEEGMKIQHVSIKPEDSQFLDCVVPDTLISMADGSQKQAKDIKKGDEIFGWKNEGIVKAKIIAVGKPPAKKLIKIKTSRGRELIATEDHPCLAIERLRTLGGRKSKIDPDNWILIKNLKIGNYVRVALGSLDSKNIMDFDESYFLGALVGDGYVRKLGCSFTSSDGGVTSYVNCFLESLGGCLKKRTSEDTNYDYDIITNGIGKKGSKTRTFLNKSKIVGKHSHTKVVPEIIKKGGESAWCGFLSGYFDTDGSIRDKKGKQTPAMYWSSVSLKLLEESQHMLALLGIQSSIYKMCDSGTKMINGYVSNMRTGYGLYIMGVSEMKKASRFLKLKHKEKARRLKEYDVDESSRYRKENFLYDRIISVEKMGIGETIGIEVEDIHTYVTNGLVTHNTRKYQKAEIVDIFFGMPLTVMGSNENTPTFASAEQFSIGFVIYALMPWIVNIEKAAYRDLLTQEQRKKYYVKFKVEGLQRGAFKDQVEAFAILVDKCVLNPNEVRDLMDMNGYGSEGDIYKTRTSTTNEAIVKDQEKT